MSHSDDAAEARALIACLDLTNLDDVCTEGDIDALIERARTREGPVAAICIWPRFVAHARARLPEGVRLATVVNFPAGGEDVDETCRQTDEAVADGADEIDLVVSWRALSRGDGETFVRDQVRRVCRAAKGRSLKAILETGELAEPRLIEAGARAALDGGARFLKTSTGKTGRSATLEAARILLLAIRDAGRPVGFKPSGGIRAFTDARAYRRLADEIMGEGWAGPETFRLGASSVLSDLLAVAGGERREGQAPAGY